MSERAQELRRQIALYRGLLESWPSLSQAGRYIRQIEEAEAELERIARAEMQPQLGA
jgi:hypothetical protein